MSKRSLPKVNTENKDEIWREYLGTDKIMLKEEFKGKGVNNIYCLRKVSKTDKHKKVF